MIMRRLRSHRPNPATRPHQPHQAPFAQLTTPSAAALLGRRLIITYHRIVERPSGQCPVYETPAAKRLAAKRQAARNRILHHYLAAEMPGGVVNRLIGGLPPNFPGSKVAELVAEPSARLSTLVASNQLLPCPLPAARRDTLAPVVVFAVARRFPVTRTAAYPPDVAVGLALASHLAIHMATASPKVSLVVVPRGYLEADPQLEQQLRDQRGWSRAASFWVQPAS
jgi:hypothetical protein